MAHFDDIPKSDTPSSGGLPPEPPPDVEQDPRFPSGKWIGFFLQPELKPGRHDMELILTFRQSVIQGEGRDRVGQFLIKGRYDSESGKCYWTKSYLKRHDVFYQGYNEGRGIWGTWELKESHHRWHGGFHIWPESMGDPTQRRLSEEAEAPASAEATEAKAEEELAVGAAS